jgi:prepilin peptidase CpaA
MLPSTIGLAAFILLLSVAAYFDLRTRRIPNRLTLAGFATGLVLALVAGGWGGLGNALLGSVAGFAVFFFLYALGAMGAGDVKLMAAAGTFLGVPLVFWGAVCSAVAGGLLAVVAILRHRATARVAANLRDLLAFWIRSGGVRRAEWLTLRTAQTPKVPFGVAIALGCAFVALFPDLSVF